MKVIATARGHMFNRIIEIGEVFEVKDGSKASWFAPTKSKGDQGNDNDISKLSFGDLKEILTARNVEFAKNATKKDLIALVEASAEKIVEEDEDLA